MAPRAVCGACGSSRRDTKPSSTPCPWLRDRHTFCLPPLPMDGPGRTRATTLCRVCCLRWGSSPCSHASLACRLQGKPGSPAETSCGAGGIHTAESPRREKGEKPANAPAAQTLWCKPSAICKTAGLHLCRAPSGHGAKLTDSHAHAPPFPIFKEHSREWMKTEGDLGGKHDSEAIYYGVIH